ncbi:hypothetical protein HMPREF0970_02322, partial [Schaalia odontolytica F0309]
SLRLGVVDLEARPGPAAAHGHRSLALRSLRCPSHQWGWVAVIWFGASSRSPARPRRRPRVLRLGPVDRVARLSETAVTFAGVGRASIETAVTFAGEKWVFLVQFSGAEVMPVSAVPCWGRAVVVLVSMSPRCRAWCAIFFALLGLMVGVSATKFAQRAQIGPNSAFLRSLGEFFCGNAAGGAVLGVFFRDPAAVGACGRTLLPRGTGTRAHLLAASTL